MSPGRHGPILVQVPPMHDCPIEQMLPQLPQLLVSLMSEDREMQLPMQLT